MLPVVVRNVQPLRTASFSPWFEISTNSMSLEMELDEAGMNRVNRKSSFVANDAGLGSASPGVGQSVWFQSPDNSDPAIKVWQSVTTDQVTL